uniref:addiction module antidote protein n=1 Tax=uncultured Anaerobiospirillum sp. TaxID=265728 RepID=UPI002805AE43
FKSLIALSSWVYKKIIVFYMPFLNYRHNSPMSESNDANHIANALGIAARGRGIKEVALLSNLSESQLEQSLNQEGNPTLDTLIKTLKALNLKIAVEPIC